MDIIDRLYKKSPSGPDGRFQAEFVTVGVVIDTNDPQQLGRVRAACPALQDNADPLTRKENEIPWAYYCSPFGGIYQNAGRGPNNDNTEGPVGYGMWAPPKVGSTVLVMCLDGDPQYRVYFGCLYGPQLTHTLPHGRYSANIPNTNQDQINGPYSSIETPIEPLFSNLTTAFQDQNNPEWRSRGADYAGSANDVEISTKIVGAKTDDKDVSINTETGTFNHRQGYALDRKREDDVSDLTDRYYDNHVYSITSPGFHSISMDDRLENGRMRFRTTTGHQIILDDTNERIYVSTAEGENWFEMDQRGNVDLYSSRRISIHGDSDINIVAGDPEKGKKGDVRIQADNFHVNTREQIRMSSVDDMHFRTEASYRVFAKGQMKFESDGSMHYTTASDMFIRADSALHQSSGNNINVESGTETSIKSGTNINMESSTVMNLKSGGAMIQQGNNWSANGGGQVLLTGGAVHLNGPPAPSAAPASSATPPEDAEEIRANMPSRIPTHEPFPRTLTDITSDVFVTDQIPILKPELDSTDPDVNKKERGVDIPRNPHWRR